MTQSYIWTWLWHSKWVETVFFDIHLKIRARRFKIPDRYMVSREETPKMASKIRKSENHRIEIDLYFAPFKWRTLISMYVLWKTIMIAYVFSTIPRSKFYICLPINEYMYGVQYTIYCGRELFIFTLCFHTRITFKYVYCIQRVVVVILYSKFRVRKLWAQRTHTQRESEGYRDNRELYENIKRQFKYVKDFICIFKNHFNHFLTILCIMYFSFIFIR